MIILLHQIVKKWYDKSMLFYVFCSLLILENNDAFITDMLNSFKIHYTYKTYKIQNELE